MAGVTRLIGGLGRRRGGSGAAAAAEGREVKEGKGAEKGGKAKAASEGGALPTSDVRYGKNGLMLKFVEFENRNYEVACKPHARKPKGAGVKAGKQEEEEGKGQDMLFRVRGLEGGEVDEYTAARVVNEAFGLSLGLVKVDRGGLFGRVRKGVKDKDAEIARLEQMLVDAERDLGAMRGERDDVVVRVMPEARSEAESLVSGKLNDLRRQLAEANEKVVSLDRVRAAAVEACQRYRRNEIISFRVVMGLFVLLLLSLAKHIMELVGVERFVLLIFSLFLVGVVGHKCIRGV